MPSIVTRFPVPCQGQDPPALIHQTTTHLSLLQEWTTETRAWIRCSISCHSVSKIACIEFDTSENKLFILDCGSASARAARPLQLQQHINISLKDECMHISSTSSSSSSRRSSPTSLLTSPFFLLHCKDDDYVHYDCVTISKYYGYMWCGLSLLPLRPTPPGSSFVIDLRTKILLLDGSPICRAQAG